MKRSFYNFGQRLATITALTALTGALVSQTAFAAQPPQGPGGGPGGPGGFRGPGGPGGRHPGGPRPISITMIPAQSLASVLNLSNDQVSRISAIQKQLQDQRPRPMPVPGQQPDRAAMEANRERMRSLEQKVASEIEAVLMAEQKSALPELMKVLNVLGMAGIFPGIIGDLKLTTEQKRQLAALPGAVSPPRPGSDGPPPDRETMEQNRRQANEQVLRILTAEQEKVVEAFRQSRPGRGPGGGRPPRQGGDFGPPPGGGYGGPPPPPSEQNY